MAVHTDEPPLHLQLSSEPEGIWMYKMKKRIRARGEESI